MITQTLISLFFCISFSIACMEETLSFIAKPLKKNQLQPLMGLAAKKIIDVFDFHYTKGTINELKKIAAQTQFFPDELQKPLKDNILRKKAYLLESINNSSAVKLSDTEKGGQFVISPNSSYLAYIAEKRHSDRSFNWPRDTITLIHIPTKKQTLITHDQIGHSPIPMSNESSSLLFSADSTSFFFSSVKPEKTTAIYQYDIPNKSQKQFIEIPVGRARLVLVSPDLEKLIVRYEDDVNPKTGIMDVATKSFNEVPGLGPVLSSDSQRLIIHDSCCKNKKIKCCQLDGTLLFELPHDRNNHPNKGVLASFNPQGDLIATTVDKKVFIWNSKNGSLIKKIIFPEKIGYISFTTDTHLITGVRVNSKCWDPHVHDLLMTDLDTAEYVSLISNIVIPNLQAKMSKDILLYMGNRMIKDHQWSSLNLYQCITGKILRNYQDQDDPTFFEYALTPDASGLVIAGIKTQIGELNTSYPYLYATHRAITNKASLPELLNLLIAEKQKINNKKIDSSIIENLKNSKSERLKEIVKERYEKKIAS